MTRLVFLDSLPGPADLDRLTAACARSDLRAVPLSPWLGSLLAGTGFPATALRECATVGTWEQIHDEIFALLSLPPGGAAGDIGEGPDRDGPLDTARSWHDVWSHFLIWEIQERFLVAKLVEATVAELGAREVALQPTGRGPEHAALLAHLSRRFATGGTALRSWEEILRP